MVITWKNQTLEHHMRNVSMETWNKLKLMHSTSIKKNEEGFTQDLIYNILIRKKSILIVEKDKKINESVTGADFFLHVKNNQIHEKFAVQAKIVYKSLRYKKLHYINSSNSTQIDCLLNNNNGYKAMHIFYNSDCGKTIDNNIFNVHINCDALYNTNQDRELMGITIFPTKEIENLSDDKMLTFFSSQYTRTLQQFIRELNTSGSNYLQFFGSEKSDLKINVRENGEYLIFHSLENIKDSEIEEYVEEFKKLSSIYKDNKKKCAKNILIEVKEYVSGKDRVAEENIEMALRELEKENYDVFKIQKLLNANTTRNVSQLDLNNEKRLRNKIIESKRLLANTTERLIILDDNFN